MKVSKTVVGFRAVVLSVVFVAGVTVARGWAPRVPAGVPGGVSADATPPTAVPAPVPLFDYNSPQAALALNAVLTDWFTSPGRRERALSLLVDPMAGPFDGSRPPLKRVVIDSRAVPGSYLPHLAGVPAVVANGMERPTQVGELKIWVDRFEVMSDGGVVVEFSQSNHGYLGLHAVYTARKGADGWRAELVSED